jgi:hypothetical protein
VGGGYRSPEEGWRVLVLEKIYRPLSLTLFATLLWLILQLNPSPFLFPSISSNIRNSLFLVAILGDEADRLAEAAWVLRKFLGECLGFEALEDTDNTAENAKLEIKKASPTKNRNRKKKKGSEDGIKTNAEPSAEILQLITEGKSLNFHVVSPASPRPPHSSCSTWRVVSSRPAWRVVEASCCSSWPAYLFSVSRFFPPYCL